MGGRTSAFVAELQKLGAVKAAGPSRMRSVVSKNAAKESDPDESDLPPLEETEDVISMRTRNKRKVSITRSLRYKSP